MYSLTFDDANRFSASSWTEIYNYDITPSGVHLDGALIDLQFMQSGPYFICCKNATERFLIDSLIRGASLA